MIITTPTIEKINDLRPHSHRLLTRCSSWSDSRVSLGLDMILTSTLCQCVAGLSVLHLKDTDYLQERMGVGVTKGWG